MSLNLKIKVTKRDRKLKIVKKSKKEKRSSLIQSMISRMEIICKVDYSQEILAENFQFFDEENPD